MLTNLKNKMMVMLMAGVMLGLGGCAGISPMKAPAQITGTADFAYKLARNNSGMLYGPIYNSPFNHEVTTVKFVCDSINNSDERCAHQDDYVVGKIIPRRQFSGGVWVIVLMEKSKEIQSCTSIIGDQCTYVKVKTEKGKLGTVVEVVALPGENKCHWSGGTVGGPVCPEWDSAKEVRKFDVTDYALTGVDE